MIIWKEQSKKIEIFNLFIEQCWCIAWSVVKKVKILELQRQ